MQLRALSRLMLLVLLSHSAAAACSDSSGPPGQANWHVPGRGWSVLPSADAATVYFAGIGHEVVAIDKASGQVRWKRSTGVSGDFTYGYNTIRIADVVVIGDVDVHAFNHVTGEPQWTFRPANDDQPGYGQLATDGTLIYAGTPEGRVYAIDGATGTQRWMTDLSGGRADGAWNPAVRDGVVFVGIKRYNNDSTGAIVALNAATGTEQWRREFTPEVEGQFAGCLGEAVFHGENVIVPVEDGRVFALRRSDGETVWIAPRVHALPPTGPWNDVRKLAASGDVVISGSSTHGIVVGLNAVTGAQLWRVVGGASVAAMITVDETAAYVGHSSTLVVYTLKTGLVRWAAHARQDSGGYWAPPLLEGNTIFISARDGFYSLRK